VRIHRIALGLGYNTDKLTPDQLPDTWEELVDPAWAGRVIVDPRGRPFDSIGLAWGAEQTIDYVNRLKDIAKPLVIEGGTAGLVAVAGGEADITTGGRSAETLEQQAEGAPIGIKYMDVVSTIDNYNIALKDTAHPNDYPHQFSGGMRQRIAIAMALLAGPDLLIADEPTTALDVTLEAQIIHLLRELKQELAGSILFVSHNLGLIAELCDDVVVMYAGEVVEEGGVSDLFHRPGHPYTQALLECDPAGAGGAGRELATIPGEVPDLIRPPQGCVFAPRCPHAFAPCRDVRPGWTGIARGHRARCHLLTGACARAPARRARSRLRV
jgi:oligopeptide/dipeptide ABC transporter ATP-binding protein